MRRGKLLSVLFLCALASHARAEVVELNDGNFEHDTQAASGQTTGVWFVEFYSPKCGACKQVEPTWASLADELRPEGIIVARVDVSANNGVAQRFAAAGLLKQLPTFILLRDRRVFTHTGGRSAETLAHFARKGFRTTEAFEVPPEPTAWEKALATAQAALRAFAQLVAHYLNLVLGSTAVRGLQRMPLGRASVSSWRIWALQYPTSLYLLAGLALAGLLFLGLILWLIFGLQPEEEEGEGGAAGRGRAGGAAGGAQGETKKDR